MARKPEPYFTVPTAAKLTQIHPETIWAMIRTGRIPAYGTRRMLRIQISDLVPELAPTKPNREKHGS
jgi:excisionase family DNA binding protein